MKKTENAHNGRFLRLNSRAGGNVARNSGGLKFDGKTRAFFLLCLLGQISHIRAQG